MIAQSARSHASWAVCVLFTTVLQAERDRERELSLVSRLYANTKLFSFGYEESDIPRTYDVRTDVRIVA